MRYGAIFSDIDIRDYKIVCSTTSAKLPADFQLKTVRVKDQEVTGSCVAHSLSSIIEYYNSIQQNDNTEMSVGYIYGNRRNTLHNGSGMVIRDALDTVLNYGDVPNFYFPYNNEVPEAIRLYENNADLLSDIGKPYRISGYYRVCDVNAAKTALLSGNPLLIAMKWYEDMEVKNGVLQTDYSGYTGGHCMFIYGWNEIGWKVQNSWGTNWGVNGRFVLPYEIAIEECWAVTDNIIEGAYIKKPFSSKFGNTFAKIVNKVCNTFRIGR